MNFLYKSKIYTAVAKKIPKGSWVCWAGKKIEKTTTSPGDLSP
jgi:hypothetical protein